MMSPPRSSTKYPEFLFIFCFVIRSLPKGFRDETTSADKVSTTESEIAATFLKNAILVCLLFLSR